MFCERMIAFYKQNQGQNVNNLLICYSKLVYNNANSLKIVKGWLKRC
jgi:hypothetical protein